MAGEKIIAGRNVGEQKLTKTLTRIK